MVTTNRPAQWWLYSDHARSIGLRSTCRPISGSAARSRSPIGGLVRRGGGGGRHGGRRARRADGGGAGPGAGGEGGEEAGAGDGAGADPPQGARPRRGVGRLDQRGVEHGRELARLVAPPLGRVAYHRQE